MADSDNNFSKQFCEDLKAKRVIPFVGAGVSKAVKKKNDDGSESDEPLFPDWKGFVEVLADALRDMGKHEDADYIISSINIKRAKYLEAMQYAKEEINDGNWYRIFNESFDKSKDEAFEESLKLADLIWKLSNNLIITTNVDRVFQWTCPKPHEYKALDVQNVEYAQLQKEQIPHRPTVWYLHGSVDNKENVIFTTDQYKSFYEEKGNEAKLQTLFSVITQKTLLFIGFSLDDEYIRQQLEYIHKIYKGAGDSFYILLRGKQGDSNNLPKYVTPIYYSDYGKPLEDLVEELARIAKEDDGNSGDKSIDVKTQPLDVVEKNVKKPFFNVPFKSKGEAFVGREGLLKKIWLALENVGRAAIGQAVNIKGIGGLGKTQLAVEYAHSYFHKYNNGVYWLIADEDINIQLINIALQLSWISSEYDSTLQAKLARERFKKLSNCLIVFDNVDNQISIKDFLPDTNVSQHILITSREEQDGYLQINLDTLNRDEARQLLLLISGRTLNTQEEKTAIEEILQELDDLPLAIELVGGYLERRKNISFKKYNEYIKNTPLKTLEDLFPNNSFTKHDQSIIRTLKISEKLLRNKQYLEDILDTLAWSGKSSMSESLLVKLVEAHNDINFDESIGIAINLRLIKKDQDSDRYSIHRLLARVRRIEKPVANRTNWLERKAKNLKEWFDYGNSGSDPSIKIETDLEHLYEWQNLISRYLASNENLSGEEKLSFYTDKSFVSGNVINIVGDGNIVFQDIRSSSINANMKDIALKPVDSKQNNYEKLLEYQLEFLSNIRSLSKEKTLEEADTLTKISNTYIELGNLQKALEYQKQALEIQKILFGEINWNVAISLNNLGTIYGNIADYQKALEYHLKALKIRREIFGDKHPDTATSFSNLGILYGNVANYSKALEYQLKALEIRREIFGDKHPETAHLLDNVGQTYSALGDSQKAIEHLESALRNISETLGNTHLDTIKTCMNLIRELIKANFREKAGRLAGEFLAYVPINHQNRKFFEYYGLVYSKALRGKKKRHRK